MALAELIVLLLVLIFSSRTNGAAFSTEIIPEADYMGRAIIVLPEEENGTVTVRCISFQSGVLRATSWFIQRPGEEREQILLQNDNDSFVIDGATYQDLTITNITQDLERAEILCGPLSTQLESRFLLGFEATALLDSAGVISAIEGSRLMVALEAADNDPFSPLITFLWLHNGIELNSSERISLNGYNITITSVEREDDGEYQLIVSNNAGFGAGNFTLDVQCYTGSYTAPGTVPGVNWNAKWSVSADSQYASFTVTAQTTGWVAIGFSLNQAMPMTDIIVGAADDSGSFSYVSDRYASTRAPPAVDAIQDIMNYAVEQVDIGGNIYTIINFTRPILSVNLDDLSLNQDIYILYAWGMENNFDASDPLSIAQHGFGPTNRGFSSKTISILCPIPPTEPPTPTICIPPAGDCAGSYSASGSSVAWSVEWAVRGDQIYFTVTAETTGWVGIGFSENNLMTMSDVIVGAANADNTMSYVSDRWVGNSRVPPTVDANQDVMMTMAEQVNGQTTVSFTRARITADPEPIDVPLNESIYFLWAIGREMNFDGTQAGSIFQHTERGVSSQKIELPSAVECPSFDCGSLLLQLACKATAMTNPTTVLPQPCLQYL